jgi:hypothetical protein
MFDFMWQISSKFATGSVGALQGAAPLIFEMLLVSRGHVSYAIPHVKGRAFGKTLQHRCRIVTDTVKRLYRRFSVEMTLAKTIRLMGS